MLAYAIRCVIDPEDADKHDLADAYGDMPYTAKTNLHIALQTAINEANDEIDETNAVCAEDEEPTPLLEFETLLTDLKAAARDWKPNEPAVPFTFEANGMQWLIAPIWID